MHKKDREKTRKLTMLQKLSGTNELAILLQLLNMAENVPVKKKGK